MFLLYTVIILGSATKLSLAGGLPAAVSRCS